MKIAILSKCNHNDNDRKVCKKIIQYLKKAGNEVFEITPENVLTGDENLQSQISKASGWGAELIIFCHLNFQSKEGCKIVYNKASKVTRKYAIKVAAFIESLGFINRGVKQDLQITNTKLPIIMIEPLI